MKKIILLGLLLATSSLASAQTPNQPSGEFKTSSLEKLAKMESEPVINKQASVDSAKLIYDEKNTGIPARISSEFSAKLKEKKQNN